MWVDVCKVKHVEKFSDCDLILLCDNPQLEKNDSFWEEINWQDPAVILAQWSRTIWTLDNYIGVSWSRKGLINMIYWCDNSGTPRSCSSPHSQGQINPLCRTTPLKPLESPWGFCGFFNVIYQKRKTDKWKSCKPTLQITSGSPTGINSPTTNQHQTQFHCDGNLRCHCLRLR